MKHVVFSSLCLGLLTLSACGSGEAEQARSTNPGFDRLLRLLYRNTVPTMLPATLAMVEAGNAKKGDVLGIARIAGIQGAKKTSDLIPLCHPLALTRVAIDFDIVHVSETLPAHVVCTATAEVVGPTGVEMEALTAVQVSLLTIYDMCKAVDRGMTINQVQLLEKHGGKSGSFVAG